MHHDRDISNLYPCHQPIRLLYLLHVSYDLIIPTALMFVDGVVSDISCC